MHDAFQYAMHFHALQTTDPRLLNNLNETRNFIPVLWNEKWAHPPATAPLRRHNQPDAGATT
ncbi:hypothetical protein [Novosphingobium sp. BL-52-GroH]|uniref:hypothetical protein n=1 Tax=Novosphingobium sp. BL-52-GroH TaxID=3349877 RepID=UPI00384C35D1